MHRPTRDADLLGFGPDDGPSLVAIFRSISELTVDDGIVFDLDSVAHFSDRGRLFQPDRGRRFSLFTDGRRGAHKRAFM